jgi:hypothetical protein
VTPENNPGFLLAALGWIINAVFIVMLTATQIKFNRSQKRHDDIDKRHEEIDKRVRELEINAVTHADLRRIESKIDENARSITEHVRSMTERLDRILERQR